MKNKLIYLVSIALLFAVTGCSGTTEVLLNPYGESGGQLGDADNSAILDEVGAGSQGDVAKARAAMKAFGEKQRAIEPQPTVPVVRPAVVRLMWVPDHLNAVGDLVPAHYYYLKVKRDEWELKDGFDNLEQLRGSTYGGGSSSTPWTFGQ